jgi:DMSO/TMAO reductase YedYZ molybdopterin-dependent catalytic subunit
MLAPSRWQTGGVPERDLLVLSEEPLNAETRLESQRGALVPAGRHYVRTHFPIPDPPSEIHIAGPTPRTITTQELRGMPSRTLTVTLECAGNGRRYLEPNVPGEQWGLGAVGTAEWTGAPLHAVLGGAPSPPAMEVLFRGADEGVPKDLGTRIAYERSLPIAMALNEDVLVAYAMDGAPIPRAHGGPVRLIVPGWYGMASVKWLVRIEPRERPFAGFYQTDRYVIDGRPLGPIEPRAVIVSPADGTLVDGGRVEVRGYAWSGHAPVERVELSEGGRPIASRRFPAGGPRYAWREFALVLSLAAGDHALVARATDRDANTQPLVARWNRLGYANNAARPLRLRVRS